MDGRWTGTKGKVAAEIKEMEWVDWKQRTNEAANSLTKPPVALDASSQLRDINCF